METLNSILELIKNYGLSLVMNVIALVYIAKVHKYIINAQKEHLEGMNMLQEKRIEELKLIHKMVEDITSSNERLSSSIGNIISRFNHETK